MAEPIELIAQAKTLDELNLRLKEVLELCLAELPEDVKKELPIFFGTQQIAVAI